MLAGVTTFADEQTRGSARYWGEQRLPIGRVWLVKIGLHALLALWLLILLAIPLAIQFRSGPGNRGHSVLAAVFRSQLFDELERYGWHGWKFLVVPAVYGFAAGHLCGLLFRKLVVACGVAGIVGGVGATLWGASLLAGGVNNWQLWLPPLVLLLTGRLLLSAWTSDRLVTRGPLVTLAGGCAATILTLAAGWATASSKSRTAGRRRRPAYVAGLPPIDENVARREFRLRPTGTPAPSPRSTPAFERLPPGPMAGPRRGSPEAAGDYSDEREGEGMAVRGHRTGEMAGPRLRAQTEPGERCGRSWPQAAAQPIGMFEYPQFSTAGGSRDATLGNARRMALALLARGLLQYQAAENKPGVFVDNFKIVLALARTLRNGTIISMFEAGCRVERTALLALDRWLERLDTRPSACP